MLDALRGRRSRRFGIGMKMEDGPLAYQSRHAPVPLSEDEEALLAFAACGITGYALADLSLGQGQGGNILGGLVGRTVSSGDAIQSVALILTNDEATYLLKRPQDFAPSEIPELLQLAEKGAFTELYRRSRVKIQAGRAVPPLEPMFNIAVNQWSLHAAGTTYFIPINELTFIYINGMLEVFNETSGLFILDERAGFQPAGLEQFACSQGGHLMDDPHAGRVSTIQRIELLVSEVVTIEQGMMLQNLGLMAQAMGLGGFPNYAEHDFIWFQTLGFRMETMPASRYLGAPAAPADDPLVPYPVGLERDGDVLLKPYCPPYYPSMEAAVRAVAEAKLGAQGVFRGGASHSAWRDASAVSAGIPNISQAAIEATIAYCTYIYERYGRFPAYLPPFRTAIGFQATHLDLEFYDRYYRPEALTDTQHQHFARWHSGSRISKTPTRKER
ncbi:MAG: hypothetical protein HYY20_04130 [Candidatus Tectomicrobia bacterium]|uniref:Uncharacterized protein n=1 Tax=Tectimicrobiota bacterium TaxID=2528274 RepID=A0A932CME5_UNCTE|nr:hypothetical protein [Candidatus Tectomicrobia bacterium]